MKALSWILRAVALVAAALAIFFYTQGKGQMEARQAEMLAANTAVQTELNSWANAAQQWEKQALEMERALEEERVGLQQVHSELIEARREISQAQDSSALSEAKYVELKELYDAQSEALKLARTELEAALSPEMLLEKEAELNFLETQIAELKTENKMLSDKLAQATRPVRGTPRVPTPNFAGSPAVAPSNAAGNFRAPTVAGLPPLAPLAPPAPGQLLRASAAPFPAPTRLTPAAPAPLTPPVRAVPNQIAPATSTVAVLAAEPSLGLFVINFGSSAGAAQGQQFTVLDAAGPIGRITLAQVEGAQSIAQALPSPNSALEYLRVGDRVRISQ